MVEQAGQGVAAAGLEQGVGLAGQARLGRPEDEVQQAGQDERRDEGDEQDVASIGVDRLEDRRRVAVDLEDRRDGSAELDRDVLLEDLGAGGKFGRRRLAAVGRFDGRGDRAVLDGLGDVVVDAQVPAAQLGPFAEQDGPVGCPDLDVDDARRPTVGPGPIDDRADLVFDLGRPGRSDAGRVRSLASRLRR